MKFISPGLHGVLDYVTVIFLFGSPWLFQMEGSLLVFTFILGGLQLLLSLFTDYPGGMVKKLSFLLHGLVEFFLSLGLVIAALYFRHTGAEIGFQYYLCLAVVYILVFNLTRFNKLSHSLTN
ncbi:MAG: hypothetical protein ABIU63_13585 [Chitinophagaceae bacterium]